MLFFVYTKEQWAQDDGRIPVLVTLDRDEAEARVLALGAGAVVVARSGDMEIERAIVWRRSVTGLLGLDVMGMQGIF